MRDVPTRAGAAGRPAVEGGAAPDRPAPPFTVVVPTHGRPERLARCLAALAALDYPRDRYAVVVVDDGSPEPLDAVVGPFAGALDLDLVRQVNAGPAAARNVGAAHAAGRYLAFTDDDCEPHPGWLAAFAAAFARAPDALLGGHVENALPQNPFAEATQILVDHLAAHADRAVAARFFPSNNVAVAREAFGALGGFDEAFPLAAGEDRDLCDRWTRAGGRLVRVPDAVVGHAHALTLAGYWRQHLHYGRGAYHVHRLLAERSGAGERLGAAFYAGLLGAPFGRGGGARAVAHAALLGLSQLATTAGYVAEASRPRPAPPAAPAAPASPPRPT